MVNGDPSTSYLLLIRQRANMFLVGALRESCKLRQLINGAMVGSGIYDLETQTNRGLKKRENTTYEFLGPLQSLLLGKA